MITFANICRLCTKQTYSDSNALSVDNDSITVADKIKAVCDIQININDCLPTSICDLCQEKLRDFYDFKLMCLYSNRLLTEYKTLLLTSNTASNNRVPVLSYPEERPTEYRTNNPAETIENISELTNSNNVTCPKTNVPEDNDILQNRENCPLSVDNDDHYEDDNDFDDTKMQLFVSQIVTTSINDDENSKPGNDNDFEICFVNIKDEYTDVANNQQESATIDSTADEQAASSLVIENEANSANHTLTSDDKENSKSNDELTESANQHNDTAGNKNCDTYFCSICNKEYSGEEIFRHGILHRGKREQTEGQHTCDICGKDFATKYSWQIHMQRHEGDRPYKCGQCGKTFTDSKYLYVHKRSHNDVKPYQCEICSKSFKLPNSFQRHTRTHYDLDKTYVCSVCGKSFVEKSTYLQHEKNHTAERRYKCSICDKAFLSEAKLRRHDSTHSNEKPFQCEICQQYYKTAITLYDHQNTHVRAVDGSREKMFTCDVCGKMLSTRTGLWSHSAIHRDERPFACELCGKTFKLRGCLRKHEKIHEKE